MADPDPAAIRAAIYDRAVAEFVSENRLAREPGVRKLLDRLVGFVLAEIARAHNCPCARTPPNAEATLMRVSTQTSPNAAAGAIAAAIRQQGRVHLSAVGAGAVNQAVKAVAIAGEFLESEGLPIACRPRFERVATGGREVTAVQLVVAATPHGPGPAPGHIQG